MINDSQIQKCLRLHKEGRSLREIARETGLSINTIRSYIADPNKGLTPVERALRQSRLDVISQEDFAAMYKACNGSYAALAEAIVKLRHDAGDLTFTISASAVRRYVLARKPELKPAKPEPAVFSVEPGEQLQIDFVECKFRFTGQAEPVKLKVFEAVYAYSRRSFILICPDATQKSWLTGIVQCLAKWGIPRTILCDNDVALVRRNPSSIHAKFNDRFVWLCEGLGVQPKACRPCRPQTKGRVERHGGTLKHNGIAQAQALVDANNGQSIENAVQLQAFLDRWAEAFARRKRFRNQQGQLLSEDDLYAYEKAFLKFPRNLETWLSVATYSITISSHATVHLHGTRIKVPYRFANSAAEVTFRADRAFFITTPSGSTIQQGVITAENFSSYKWDDRAPDTGAIQEVADPLEDDLSNDDYFNEVTELYGV